MKSWFRLNVDGSELRTSLSTVLLMLFMFSLGVLTASFFDEMRFSLLFSFPVDCSSFFALFFGNSFSCGIFVFFSLLLGASVFGFFAMPILSFLLGYSLCCSLISVILSQNTECIAIFGIPWAIYSCILISYFSLCYFSSREFFAACGSKVCDDEKNLLPERSIKLFFLILALLLPIILTATLLEYFLYRLFI